MLAKSHPVLCRERWSLEFAPLQQRQCRCRKLVARATKSSAIVPASKSFTQQMFESMERTSETGGAGGSVTYEAFKRADEAWFKLRNMKEGAAAGPAPKFVTIHPLPALAPVPSASSPPTSSHTSHRPPTPKVSRASNKRPSSPSTSSHASSSSPPSSQVASPSSSASSSASHLPLPPTLYDVVVCGGTLGVFVGAALAQRGWRVAVVERGPLRGRAQEWNISRRELGELVELGLLTAGELEEAIAMEFNPVRVAFHGTPEVWTRDVLNVGVRPDVLIRTARHKLEAAGGRIFEGVALNGVIIHPDCAVLQLHTDPSSSSLATSQPSLQSAAPSTSHPPPVLSYGTQLHARLVLDCMGHASPIVRQIRWGRKPDGVCMVVGTLGSGYTHNTTGDVIATVSDLQPDSARVNKVQFFWEAFPAGSGPTDRTTYMFAYMDAAPTRPAMADVFEEYWPLLERYQGIKLSDITFKRALFGLFPTYRDSPLRPGFDRVLQIGDASGIQSPLSFGGFGALTRHLPRLTRAVAEALGADALERDALGGVHAYNPGLSSAWMMQRAMSVRPGDAPPPDLINRMLGANFNAMQALGEPTLKPFLQDVIQFIPLLRTMGAQMITDPLSVPQLVRHVGPGPLADWLLHVSSLGAATLLHAATRPLRALIPSPAPGARAPHATSSAASERNELDQTSAAAASTSRGSSAGVKSNPSQGKKDGKVAKVEQEQQQKLPVGIQGLPGLPSIGSLTPRQAYFLNRVLDAIEFGAGADYKL